MSDTLALVNELLGVSKKLDRDNFGQELEDHCWPIVDFLDWTIPTDVLTFNAALYYGETLQENTPAHLLSGGVYNEWTSAVKADRFPAYRQQKNTIDQRAQTVLRSPLMKDTDPFWLMFPNNINLNNWNPTDVAVLMALAAHSSSIKSYKPFGVLLYIHGHPVQWISANPGDPGGQAAQGLNILAQPLRQIAERNYKYGTFQ